ncbi:MAG: hypothetical protein ACM3N4_10905 [Nitrososphaerota archaeon]
MKRFQRHVLLTMMVCVSLAIAACGSGANAGSPTGKGGVNAPVPAATATTKPKPTALPKITVAFCQGIMTVAQANQIMHPTIPATMIRVDSPASGGGSCNYEYATYRSVVTITFEPYTGGPGNAQAVFAAADKQLPQANNATITVTKVTGVGDAAQFVTGVINVARLKMAALQVIYGSIFLACANYNVQGSSFSTQQTYLTQVCQQFVSQL